MRYRRNIGLYYTEASNTLTARTLLSSRANVVLDMGCQVILMPGFFATQGSLLRVVNKGCIFFYRQGNITL